MNHSILLLLTIFLGFSIPIESSVELLPVSTKGRFRPLEVYSRIFLQDLYHSQQLEPQDQTLLHLSSPTATEFLLTLSFDGREKFDNVPLFYITSKPLREELKLKTPFRISYNDLKASALLSANGSDEISKLKASIAQYEQTAANLKMLPLSKNPIQWEPLDILASKTSNPTLFSDATWQQLQNLYKKWREAASKSTDISAEAFADVYFAGYIPISGVPHVLSQRASLYYPTPNQLKAELFYYRTPMISYAAVFYLGALALFLLSYALPALTVPAGVFAALGFTVHTIALCLRCYILWRPPVSNMAETMIYVPWIIIIVGALLSLRLKSKAPIISACGGAVILLALLERTLGAHGLENVQAVLNSQLWLTIHVLMIVGSYGVLILAGLLGHIALASRYFTATIPKSLTYAIEQSIYIGVALLIPGTILGGVWAAQSWGRFWDWDPKESWAFITACLYLVIIHSYRFNRIGANGLAIGSILGLMAVSFTWYGVNYILGTGLHTYGFGSGGEWVYYTYLLVELAFIAGCLLRQPKTAS